MRSTPMLLYLAFAICAALPADGQSSEADAAARLVHKSLYLRGFWRNDKLKFDAVGTPLGKPMAGSFTLSGVQIDKVTLRSDGLLMEGSRAALRFTSGLPERVLLPDHMGSQRAEKVRIEIQAPADRDYGKALDAVFATKLSDLVPSLPDYWQPYAQEHLLLPQTIVDYVPESLETPDAANGERAKSEKNAGSVPTAAARIGGSVKAPRPIKMSDPKFSQEARQMGASGTVLVYLWVDQAGHPTHVSIKRPCGMGLDETAVEAVKQYLFNPATRDGVPVTVEMNVEVNFSIF